jgi:hypothetical protein
VKFHAPPTDWGVYACAPRWLWCDALLTDFDVVCLCVCARLYGSLTVAARFSWVTNRSQLFESNEHSNEYSLK